MPTSRLTVDVTPGQRKFSLALPGIGQIECLVASRSPNEPTTPLPKERKALAKRRALQLCDALKLALEKY
jgi:hypothetical protein